MSFERLNLLSDTHLLRQPAAVLCDVDRTLLRHDHSLPEDVATAARDLPFPLILASARSPIGLHHVHDRTGAEDLAVCFNGAWIGNPQTRQPLYALPLPRDAAEFAFSLILELGGAPAWFGIDHAVALTTQADCVGQRIKVTGDPLRLVDHPSEISGTPFKLLATVDPDRIAEISAALARTLRDVAYVAQSGPGLIEIVHPEVSKGVALHKVAEILGVTPERLAAAGDSSNDIEMLRAAGLRIVPDNASTEVKKFADVVVPHCDEGGIAHGFRWLATLPE